MKRYKLELTKYDRQLLDDPNGEWVRFEEAEAWRTRALAAEAVINAYLQRNYMNGQGRERVVSARDAWLAAKANCERLER